MTSWASQRSSTVSLWHFLYTNVLDVMGRQPFQEHFLLLGELNDRMLLSIQGGDEFKDTIGEPLRAMLGVDPVVMGCSGGTCGSSGGVMK